ncbi:hypothetical protein QR680_008217 [Steinernema hermaphroditum]|uniref:Decapping nuclease n=1 Tax=Steinernema hermaphroditum TaxID=289476 RepID=A0AA39M7N7_9BILA|nr:hypothetical protein QR680_008217 [Steinernema hermaphroditum]
MSAQNQHEYDINHLANKLFYDVSKVYADMETVEFTTEQVSDFTVDKDGKVTAGSEKAGRLRDDLLGVKLNIDIDSKMKELKDERKLPYLALFDILENRAKRPGKSTLKDAVEGCPIAASRGALHYVAAAPHNTGNNLRLLCCLHQGTVFIVRQDKYLPGEDEQNLSTGDLFENLMIDDMSNRYYVQTVTTLGNFKLFLSGEVDCLDGEDNQVELKCRKGGLDSKIMWNRCSAEWYMQSVLLGTHRIVVGNHDTEKILSATSIRAEQLETDRDAFCDVKPKFLWKKDALLVHLHAFLEKVVDITKEYEGKVVVIEKTEKQKAFYVTELRKKEAMFPATFLNLFK